MCSPIIVLINESILSDIPEWNGIIRYIHIVIYSTRPKVFEQPEF